MQYSSGGEIRIGHVVDEPGRPEQYIVIGFERDSSSVKLLLIGTVQKEHSPSFGKTIILPNGFMRSVPAGALERIGFAEINVAEDDPTV